MTFSTFFYDFTNKLCWRFLLYAEPKNYVVCYINYNVIWPFSKGRTPEDPPNTSNMSLFHVCTTTKLYQWGGGWQCVFMILNFFTSLRLLPPRFACSRPAAPAPVSLRLLAPRCACCHLAALALASLCLLPPGCACSEAQPRCARSESTPKL